MFSSSDGSFFVFLVFFWKEGRKEGRNPQTKASNMRLDCGCCEDVFFKAGQPTMQPSVSLQHPCV